MKRPNAIPGGTDVTLCQARSLEGEAPEWVQLLAAGVNETASHSGPFTFDPRDAAEIIANSAKASPDGKLPIDLNHAIDLASRHGGPSPAQGWIEKLEARPDGLWGQVSWTEAGKAALADRAYRFISPVVTHLKSTGKVVAVLRAALTNNPNLHGLKPVLNTATEENDMALLVALCAALGIAETTDETAALAAVRALKAQTALNSGFMAEVAKAAKLDAAADHATVLNAVTALADPAKMVPKSVVDDMAAALNAADARIKALEDGGKKKAAEDFVDGAIKAGRAGLNKASRDYFIGLHMADAVSAEKAINGFPVITGELITQPQPDGTGVALNAADQDLCKMLGIKPEDFAATRKQIEGGAA